MKKIVCSIAAAAIVLSQTAAVAEAGYFGDVYEESTGEFYLAESDDYSIIYRQVDRRGYKWQNYYRDAKGDLYYANTFDYYISRLEPYPNDDTHPEAKMGKYDGYDLTVDRGYPGEYDSIDYYIGWDVFEEGNKRNAYFSLTPDLYGYDFSGAVVRIPNSITIKSEKRTGIVKQINGSCNLKFFDLDPENEYMKCVDNVLFSKDGKKLMSFAQHDERREYAIPEGTCSIVSGAFKSCYNLRKISFADTVTELSDRAFADVTVDEYEFSDSVEIIPKSCFDDNYYLKRFYISPGSKLRKIEEYAFWGCDDLTELYLPSFEIEIDRKALSSFDRRSDKVKPITLKSYVQPTVQKEGNSLKWDKIPNASYYEVYQRLGNGEYKLLSTTKGTSCKLPALGKGKKYTFAVKPVAVIPGANYDKERDETYPESFTVEGTMSEDITVER
ncbi:MAG: leucine-rich repeat domain-containing protein [Oscillospiraceae bacterium]|nr:leucine-rich repeat domain-containing protein [Oscillospiraceae bacterium]